MSERNLVLVTHYYSTHLGGVELVAAELARRLAQTCGYTIEWVASDTDAIPENLPASVIYIPAKTWDGLERMFGVHWPVWSLGALHKLWKVMYQADVVHIHDALYFGSLFARLFARLRGIPVIVTQHVGHVPYRSAWLRGLHALANRTLGRLVLSNAAQVVFISPAVHGEFERYCRFRTPPLYLPNGVDLNVFTPEGDLANDAPIAAARGAGRRVFIFVGRFVEKKGLHILRTLATAFTDDLWLFAGQGPMDPEKWGLRNVRVIRGASRSELAQYYRAADLLVLPSVGEGFPLVVQESMACGTPVMVGEETAAGCPAAEHLMYVEKVGSDDTVARWSAKLATILDDKELLSDKRREVFEFARKNWSWDAAAEAYAKVFSSVMQEKRRKSINKNSH